MDEVPFLLPPPRTRKQVLDLLNEHGGMFGVCWFCGTAGHVDQIVSLTDDDPDGIETGAEACGGCVDKIDKGII